MKISILGYGKMGKEIEKIALEHGHEILTKIDNPRDWKKNISLFKKSDIAIDFSTPQTAIPNIYKCFEYDIPIVIGTTGWYEKFEEIKNFTINNNKALFYASNFSIGVNIFFKINNILAKIMNGHKEYNVKIQETHHIHKLDAPSGTAITLANGIIENLDNKKSWTNNKTNKNKELEITSIRKGEISGIHSVEYDSDFDTIELKHSAKSRKAFAMGAVIAAEWLYGKKGVFNMNDILSENK